MRANLVLGLQDETVAAEMVDFLERTLADYPYKRPRAPMREVAYPAWA